MQRRGDILAWLFGIMHNHFIDTVRSAKRRLEDCAGDELPKLPQKAYQADRLEVRDLYCALQRLPAEQRVVLLLVAVEKMSYCRYCGGNRHTGRHRDVTSGPRPTKAETGNIKP